MFNMVPKPTRRNDAAATFDVVKPDSDVEGCGRLGGEECPSAEEKKGASTAREAGTEVGRQE